MIRRKKKLLENETHIEVSLTPLIDTLLVLLIVFMIAAPAAHHLLQITLPSSAANEQRDSRHDFFIAIDQYGRLYGKQYEKIDLPSFLSQINQQLALHPHLAVVLYADKDVLYGHIAETIDKIKRLGVRHVYLETKQLTIS